MNNDFKRLFRFDSIRLFKLLEICYYSIIAFILTLITIGIFEDDSIFPFFLIDNPEEKEYSYINLLSITLFDIAFIVIIIYYLTKILKCIPFLFKYFNKKYKPSFKNEMNTGINIGIGMILYYSLHSLDKKIKKLIDYNNIFINKLILNFFK